MPQLQTDLAYPAAKPSAQVECLGMTFESDDARRAYFRARLAEHLAAPAFRNQEGFPVADDDAILRLSDPPYYTACPNPFLAAWVRHYGRPYDPVRDDYARLPFATDVSEGKTDPLYKAHSYHTKVPHRAILRSIIHYTEPGDLVLDGFCGSGMTGVAAQLAANPGAELKRQIADERKMMELPEPVWGARRAILNDLSPAATFIAAGFNLPFDVDAFAREGRRILAELKKEIGWMYETLHTDGKTKGQINYTIWSEVYACPECAGEIVFMEEALDMETKRVRETFPCPLCSAELTKDRLERTFATDLDKKTGEPWRHVRFRPVLINYSLAGRKAVFEKKPDADDLALLERIASQPIPDSVPSAAFPVETMSHGSRIAPKGFRNVHHFYLPRAAHALGRLWISASSAPDGRMRNALLYFVEQAIWGLSLLNRYGPTHFSQVNRQLSGVYYIAAQHSECSPWYNLGGKLARLTKAFSDSEVREGRAVIASGTCTQLNVPDAAVDYIFTDPPFGENIYYADLNFLVEAWHGVTTDPGPEAIVDSAKKKDLLAYKRLMERSFAEYYRVLKPGRWITVVFHNSKNAVWHAIQESLQAVGFAIADVSVLDKQQGSYRQVTSDTTKKDLVISAFKPGAGFEDTFRLKGGTEEGAWHYVRSRLKGLPVPRLIAGAEMEYLAERGQYMLFDRMVAFHVGRGITVPLSNAEFFEGLRSQFVMRDGMYFLPEQVAAYDKKRARANGVQQYELFVTNEESAIRWVRRELEKRPTTFDELQPRFMKVTPTWSKLEAPLDLRKILEQNFIRYDGAGLVPAQILANLSSKESQELKGLANDAPLLREKTRDRWYVPDPKKQGDMEKVRERELLGIFEEYRKSDKRTIKPVRAEALRAGFKKAYRAKDYNTIVVVAKKVPEDVIGEDELLLRLFDNAMLRAGDPNGPLFDR